MRIDLSTPILDQRLASEFRRFVRGTGEALWKRKIERLASPPRRSKHDLYANYLASRNPLIPAVSAFFESERSARALWKEANTAILQAGSYVFLINRLLHHGPDTLRTRVKGILSEDDIRAFLFEIDTATHFFRRGYDVEFLDLAGSASFDLLISGGGYEIEVECKRKSADAGRKITRAAFFLLSDILFTALSDVGRRFALVLTVTDRMGTSEERFRSLSEHILQCLTSERTESQFGEFTLRIDYLPDSSRVRNLQDAQAQLSSYASTGAHLAICDTATTTIILKCESTQRDRVVRAIYKELKAGAKQFSRKRAGLMACLIEDIDNESWGVLKDQGGLLGIAKKLFHKAEASHLRFLTFSSDRTPPSRAASVVEFTSTALDFENPNCLFPVPRSFLRMEVG